MRIPLVLLAALGAFACSSTSNVDTSGPMRVELRDFQSDQTFALVSGTSEERLEYYSEQRDTAATKVQTNEVMEALLEYFAANGFEEMAIEGQVAAAPGTASKSIEVSSASGTRHALRRDGMTVEDARAFLKCMQAFLELYGHTFALQSVESKADFDFQGSERRD